MIYTTLHKTLKIVEHEPHKKILICFHYLANVSCFHSQCLLFSKPMSVVMTMIFQHLQHFIPETRPAHYIRYLCFKYAH
jgi:hypothetical protein